MPHTRVIHAYLAVSVAALVGYFLLGEPLGIPLYMGMSALVVAAVVVGVKVNKPTDARPWIVLALAQMAFLIADGLWYLLSAVSTDGNAPFPSIADGFYLAGYPLLTAGMIMFIRDRQPRYRLVAAIDALLIGMAAVLVLWITVIDSVIHDEAVPLAERIVTIAYPIGDAMILAAAAYMLLTGSHGRRSMYLLAASLVALLVGDVFQTTLATGDGVPMQADLMWLISYALFGLAALDPSMRELSDAGEQPIRPEGARRLIVLGIAITALPAFAVYQRFFLDHQDLPVTGIVGLIVIVAVLLRMHEQGAVLGRSERRYAALLANASDAFAVVKPDGRFTYVSPASERVLGYPMSETVTRSAFEFVHARARTRAAAVLTRVGSTPGASEELEVPVRRADGAWRWLSVTVTNRTDDPIVDGIVLNYRDVTERKELEQRLERQAFTDALTDLSNRPLFIDRLSHLVARRRRSGAQIPVSVLFLDVDDFKTVNDSLGHAAGDQLLIALADRLRATIRPADTAARLGGDEFAVLLENAAESEARKVASRVLSMLSDPVLIANQEVRVSVSIGIAVDTDGVAATAEELLRDADLAMYSAKSTAPGTYAVYDATMHEEVVRRLERKADHEAAADRARGRNKRPTTRWEPTATNGMKVRPAAP